MSEPSSPETPLGPSAGTLLREAREAAGLHIAALAVSLKVPVKKLEALEADRFDLLPDAVFIRALASSVCRTLKVDPAPVLERLPQTSTPRLIHDDNGINAPFRAPSDAAGPSWLDQLSKPVFLAVFALLLGALVLIFMPSLQREDKQAKDAGNEMAVTPPPVQAPPAEPTVAPVPPVASKPAEVAAPVVVPAPVSVVQAPVTAQRPVGAASSAVLATAPATTTPSGTVTAAQPLVAGTIVFRAKGDSWVEVTDARGVVAPRKLLVSGEAASAGGNLPLTVIVGRADITEVQVRGKPFDLASVSRDNVARFEVK